MNKNGIKSFDKLAELLSKSKIKHVVDNTTRSGNANCGQHGCTSDKVCKTCIHFNANKTTQVDSKLESGREFA